MIIQNTHGFEFFPARLGIPKHNPANPFCLGGGDILYPALILSAVLVIILIVLNRHLYGFFLEERGFGFTLLAIPMHFLYFFYSGASYGVCWLKKKMSK